MEFSVSRIESRYPYSYNRQTVMALFLNDEAVESWSETLEHCRYGRDYSGLDKFTS